MPLRSLAIRTLFCCALMMAAGLAAAEGARLADFQWNSEGGRLSFDVRFDRAVRVRTTDNLREKKYFYVDFYDVEGPAEPEDFKLEEANIFIVKRLYYEKQRALRFVFYTRLENLRMNLLETSDRVFKIAVEERDSQTPTRIVVIDPGHGGKSLGAETSRRFEGRTQYEKELVLDIALRLQRLIDATPGLEAFMTRTDDTFVSLERRIELADKTQGDLFISIHLNATDTRRKNARGFEVYYLSDGSKETNRRLVALENDEQHLAESGALERQEKEIRDYILRSLADERLAERKDQSAALADIINQSFLLSGPFVGHNRGVKSAAFRVLMNFTMPAVLVECGFIDNTEDATQLMKPETRETIAGLLLKSVQQYFAMEEAAVAADR